MTRRGLLLCLLTLALLGASAQGGPGVVLFKNGYRYYGDVEDMGDGITIIRPHGLEGSWYVPKSDIKYFSSDSNEIPEEFLGGTVVRKEDIERSQFVLEYKRLEKEMSTVIGKTKARIAARERRRGDQLLKEKEYKNTRLNFGVRPPRGWKIVDPSGENYVMFIGPKHPDSPYQPRIHVVSHPAPKADFDELTSSYVKDLRAYHGDSLKSFLDLGTKEFVDQDQWTGSLVISHGDLTIKSRRFLVRHRRNGRVYLLSVYTDPDSDTRNLEIFTYWMNSLTLNVR